MINMRQIILGIFVAILLTNISSADVELAVTPVDDETVVPGGTISYIATVTVVEEDLVFSPQTEQLAIANPRLGWSYSFGNLILILTNGIVGNSDSTILTISVPDDAHAGSYSHTVVATGCINLDSVDVIVEGDSYEINPDVSVPEFPTIAVPMVAVIGIMALFTRRKI